MQEEKKNRFSMLVNTIYLFNIYAVQFWIQPWLFNSAYVTRRRRFWDQIPLERNVSGRKKSTPFTF